MDDTSHIVTHRVPELYMNLNTLMIPKEMMLKLHIKCDWSCDYQ